MKPHTKESQALNIKNIKEKPLLTSEKVLMIRRDERNLSPKLLVHDRAYN